MFKSLWVKVDSGIVSIWLIEELYLFDQVRRLARKYFGMADTIVVKPLSNLDGDIARYENDKHMHETVYC